jgi:hypothetical protein
MTEHTRVGSGEHRTDLPACSASTWHTEEYDVSTPYSNRDISGIGPDFVPFVCAGCGYTKFHAVSVPKLV